MALPFCDNVACWMFELMRYHFEKPSTFFVRQYGKTYTCNHPLYSSCTLFQIGTKGLAVIQQRFDEEQKSTWWSELDPWIPDAIYLSPGFLQYFESRAKEPTNGLYPTVSVRQIMWALKLKPLPKYRWETVFDRKEI